MKVAKGHFYRTKLKHTIDGSFKNNDYLVQWIMSYDSCDEPNRLKIE